MQTLCVHNGLAVGTGATKLAMIRALRGEQLPPVNDLKEFNWNKSVNTRPVDTNYNVLSYL